MQISTVAWCRVQFASTPIPSDILKAIQKATKKPVGEFYHCSTVLKVQEKLLDPRLTGKINWRCAVQRNDKGQRVWAGVHTGDAAIAAQQKFCKNDKEHVLSLFLYADKTCVTGDSRVSYWPVYLELANLHDKARMLCVVCYRSSCCHCFARSRFAHFARLPPQCQRSVLRCTCWIAGAPRAQRPHVRGLHSGHLGQELEDRAGSAAAVPVLHVDAHSRPEDGLLRTSLPCALR